MTGGGECGSLSIKPHVFEAGDGQKVEAELGRLVVPENRRDLQAGEIELAFVRFKSTAARPGPPVVYLAGGPGGSGIGTARGPRFHQFMAMREAGDVIALDQRGVGFSQPKLKCREPLGYPLDRPGDREEILRLYGERSRACALHWTEQGVDLRSYNTEENADDVEALRQALGVEQLSLWSTSYGTHLALAVIRRHGGRVHRAVMAGVEGPDHTLKLPATVHRHLEQIAALCRSDASVGRLVPDLLGSVQTLCSQLEARPVTAQVVDPMTGEPVPVTVGRFDLQWFTASLPGRIDALRAFPAAVHAMLHGDFTALAQFALTMRRAPLWSAMSWMMDCSSWASDERYARFERERQEYPIAALVDFPFPDVCSAWGSPDLGPAFRSPVRSDVPVLFMSGALDGRTPPENVEEIRPGFPHSAHVIIENTAHGDHLLLSTPRTGEVMVEFMKGAKVTDQRLPAQPLQFTRVGG
jgi:pimeloyl-ACP methyl ester carboxylesterase